MQGRPLFHIIIIKIAIEPRLSPMPLAAERNAHKQTKKHGGQCFFLYTSQNRQKNSAIVMRPFVTEGAFSRCDRYELQADKRGTSTVLHFTILLPLTKVYILDSDIKLNCILCTFFFFLLYQYLKSVNFKAPSVRTGHIWNTVLAYFTSNSSLTRRLKVRGHNLVWSVGQQVQDWVKQLSGTELRNVVKQHIEETMNKTRGL